MTGVLTERFDEATLYAMLMESLIGLMSPNGLIKDLSQLLFMS